jgi:hypothetical protein
VSFNPVLENRTPFEATTFVFPDGDGQEVLLIVMAATFAAPPGAGLRLAEEPSPIRTADEPRGDPAASSTTYESDVALAKPFVDVLAIGHAYAPPGTAANQVAVRIQVGDVNKTLLVTGDRGRLGGVQPFERMPIIYERAFGGTNDQGEVDPRNPIGVGYRGARSSDPDVHTVAPNIAYPNQDREPAGFGALGRGWKPRIDFAGTYDQEWLDTRWPILPSNFDGRHYQAAPLDQQSRSIQGGEHVQVVNMTPEGVWRFRLPVLDVPVHLLYADRQQRARLSLDTVLIEPDCYRVTLTSRLGIRTIRNAGFLREVVLGHVTSGWLRARLRRKLYIDRVGAGGGTDMQRATFQV